MSRLNIEDTPITMCVKMSNGNPGALSCLMAILENAEVIDPENILGALGVIMFWTSWKSMALTSTSCTKTSAVETFDSFLCCFGHVSLDSSAGKK